MSQGPFEHHTPSTVLTQIYEGMSVYDCEGDKVGTVKNVYFGTVSEEQDERGLGAATASPPGQQETSLLEDFAKTLAAPEPVPEPLRQRLLRHGFIRINTSGILAADRYAMPDQIESVSDNRVTLRVGYEELMKR
jgi:hypothetical protein